MGAAINRDPKWAPENIPAWLTQADLRAYLLDALYGVEPPPPGVDLVVDGAVTAIFVLHGEPERLPRVMAIASGLKAIDKISDEIIALARERH